ncbi:ferritin-like domain-containing protein, partial [Phakopsora pachyrhizi]
SPADINLVVLNFALTLENLEAQFYQDALAIFPPQVMQQAGLSAFQATAITQQIQRQLIDEQSHVSTLQAAIQGAGATPFAGCQFNFRSVLTDPVTFLASARSIEAAGVSAYIGGASLITNPAVLGAAATILPIEARHSSLLNLFAGGSSSPQAFDIPLSPPQVLAVVGGLLQNCQASDLGLTVNQPLSVIDGVTQSTLFTTGSILQFQTSAQIQSLQANTLSCQMLIGGATNAIVMPASSCIVPAQAGGGQLNGIAAVFLTSNAQPLSTNIAAQPQNVVAGPALIFVDGNQQDILPQLFTVKSLNLKSLPTANLASAALTPQKSIGVNKKVESGENSTSAAPKRLNAEINDDKADSGMFHVGFNDELQKMSWSAIPKGVVQSPSQVKSNEG